MKSRTNDKTLFLWAVLSTMICAGGFAATITDSATVTGINLVNSVRVGRTTYDYMYTVTVQNGPTPLESASATVTSSDPNTIVVAGSVTLGSLGSNSRITSSSTFTIEQNRLVPFNPSSLSWHVTGTAVVGSPVAIIDLPAQVLAYSSVLLDGTPSTDPTSKITGYAWRQTSGPQVVLQNANDAKASFLAPGVSAPSAVAFELKVTDVAGATSIKTASTHVLPLAANGSTPTFVALHFLRRISPGGHTDAIVTGSSPLSGAMAQPFQAVLSGAIGSPSFTMTDASGNLLSSIPVQPAGLESGGVIDYVGSINVPTSPFFIVASGTTVFGKSYSLRSPALIAPINMSLGFSPSYLLLARSGTTSTQLQIYNAGPPATFSIRFSDPQSALTTPGGPLSLEIGQGQTSSVPIGVSFPSTIKTTGVVKIDATALVYGDPQRVATATLDISLDGKP